jgi:short-subunit dehydrogenase
MKERVVVITGASAGIGAALASVVAGRGGRPVLLARRAAELEAARAAAGASAKAWVCDVTKRADVDATCAKILADLGGIDVWVNNAGRGISRAVSDLTDEDVDEMILVNVKSVLYATQAVLPHFRARGRGHVINVSSMLGRMPLAPIRSMYSASKHALNALTASLRMELRASAPGIVISSVHPGVVATDFGKNSRHGGMDSRAFPGAQSALEVAEVIADVIEQPRADVYTRPGAREMVAAYFAAEDMGDAETKPPFFGSR